jgi:uncharacterized protein
MPIEIGYFTLCVPDVNKGAAFYGGVFGWTFDPSPASHPYRHINNTQLPGGLVSHDPKEGVVRPYYRVDDIRGATAKVRALGGKTEEITQSESGLGCLCHDDQGVPFHLWQPAPGF